MSETLFYGVTDQKQIDIVAGFVCDILGYGATGCAFDMIMETVAAETQLATYPDNSPGVGVGLGQFDPIGFNDTKRRTRTKHRNKLLDTLGVDVKTLELADLENDPINSIVFIRLKYLLRPEPIPDNREGRAEYWKKFYNIFDSQHEKIHTEPQSI